MKIFALTIIVAHLCLPSYCDEEYRSFSDQQGRTIKAKLLFFDPIKNKLIIERDNRRRATVSPSVFSVEDQNYIHKWTKAYLLKDKRNVTYSIDENVGDVIHHRGVEEQNLSKFTRYRNHSFTIEIKNKSNVDFGNIRLECNLLINRQGYRNTEDNMYCESDTSFCELGLLSTTSIKTKKFKLFERYIQATESDGSGGFDSYELKDAIEEVEGVIFRLYLADDTDVSLEFCEPSGFLKKFHWNEFQPRQGKEKSGLMK
tara:strand:+ start:3309 stop:4082 length:774 start_codon:yes stop_codon:yes gene_type:complete